MFKLNKTSLVITIMLSVILVLSGCNFKPPQIKIPTPSFPAIPSTSSPGKTISPEKTTNPTASPTLQMPTTQVDIYTKTGNWPFKDPADMVMSPSVLGFAWNLDSNPDTIPWAHRNGAKFIGEVSLWNHDGWRTLSDLPAALKTAYNTDFDGEPLYSQDMVYLNVNDPAYQKWLSDFLKNQIDQGADGFVFDETNGSAEAVSMGGGFDIYSPVGFGDYLAQKYSSSELKNRGISSTAGFDYKQYLTASGQDGRYRRGDFWNLPFGADYFNFLEQKTSDLITKLIGEATAYAASKGKKLLITANADPIYRGPSRPFYDLLDYYTFEHGFISNDWRREPGYADFAYGAPVTSKIKYARSRNQKSVVLMAIGEYGALAKKGLTAGTSLVLHDFAETYANLGFFCYFDLDTAFIGNRFVADHARLRPYYAFLREHPEAFNGLSFKPETAVIVPPLAVSSDYGPIDSAQGVSFILSESNIPYDVVDIDKASDYKVVIANGYAWSDTQLDKLLNFTKSGGIVIAMDERFASRDGNYKEVRRPELDALKSDGAHKLGAGQFIFFRDSIGWKYWARKDAAAFKAILNSITPYVSPDTAPAGIQLLSYSGGGKMVVHILNYNYAGDEFVSQKNAAVSVQIPADFSSASKTLKLLSPDGNAVVTLNYTVENNRLNFTVPDLYIWSVAVLQ